MDEAQTRITPELNALRPAPRSRAWITPDDLESISEARRIELSAALVEVAGLNAWPTDGRKDPGMAPGWSASSRPNVRATWSPNSPRADSPHT